MNSKVVLVTGANRSIGLSIVQALATRNPSDHIIMTARSLQSIDPAIEHLRAAGVKNEITSLELDVTSDKSIESAASIVQQKFGGLNVLVNNAGIASSDGPSLAEKREAFTLTLDTNVTSVAATSVAFMPLLRAKSSSGYKSRIINVSSGRASLTWSTTGNMPPTLNLPYSVSKVALNALTIEFQKMYPDVLFYAANPGHCATAFNGFKGRKDPLDGARVVVELVDDGKEYEWGFWEVEGVQEEATRVPW